MVTAKVQKVNGSPAIVVNGQTFPPMAMTTQSMDKRYLKALGDAGIKVFFVICDTDWLKPDGVALFRKEAENLLSAVPDAYMFLRIGMHPPMAWFEEHSDQLMTYNDGSHKPAWLLSESYQAFVPGAYSLCSHLWRRDGEKALMEHIRVMEGLPYADRIIGYFLAAGGTSEWYYINPLVDRENKLYGDFSAAFREEFTDLLREKYGTVEALRAAWGMAEVTFEQPVIPTLEDRCFSYIDREIQIGERPLLQLNPEDGPNNGVFLNADKYQHVADFYRAWQLGTARSIIHFAKAVKAHNPDILVGSFYGYFGCSDFLSGSNTSGVLEALDSGVVDFMACPGVYNNRGPGGVIAQREMQDSFRLRNTMFVVEDDTRTHMDPPLHRDSMRTYDAQDSLDVMKRDFGRNICEDLYGWWFDQTKDRYDDPAILSLIARQQQVSRFAMDQDRVKGNEIALIYDQESVSYVSQTTSAQLCDYYRTSDLHRIGAPVDYYFHDDMAREDMPDYRMYVFINAFVLTDAERAAIARKARKNGQVVVWLYAQGFINPDRSPKLNNAHVADLTGIAVGRLDETCSPRFRLCCDHPALALADKRRLYGDIDRVVTSSVWVGPPIPPNYNNPGFYVDDGGAVVLGRYCVDGRPALALKETADWTSILCTSKILRSDLLQSFAGYAGAHLYTRTDDVFYANRSFVTLHANSTGVRTLYFPAPCSPWEVYEQRYYGKNVTKIDVDVYEGQTLMFSLKGPC